MVKNFRFPGQYYDQETGLHYDYFSYYDPRMGRYLTPDPSHSIKPRGATIPYLLPYLLNTPQEFNSYIYCLNDPINGFDYLGLKYWARVWKNFQTTNMIIPGVFAPTGAGIFAAERMAQVLGTATLRAWISGGLGGATLSGASFTGLETGVLVGASSLINFALTGFAREAGVGAGSLISAIAVYGTDQSITDWWANFWWDLLNDENDEKPDSCE